MTSGLPTAYSERIKGFTLRLNESLGLKHTAEDDLLDYPYSGSKQRVMEEAITSQHLSCRPIAKIAP
jgi:hypothetical protein